MYCDMLKIQDGVAIVEKLNRDRIYQNFIKNSCSIKTFTWFGVLSVFHKALRNSGPGPVAESTTLNRIKS